MIYKKKSIRKNKKISKSTINLKRNNKKIKFYSLKLDSLKIILLSKEIKNRYIPFYSLETYLIVIIFKKGSIKCPKCQ